jgi:hypothetical protein
MTTNDLLKQGIAALNAGRKAEARRLLMQVIQQDERNEMGWLWLSGAVDTDDDRRICLENVLAINPNNGIARRGLESLIAKEGVRSLRSLSPPTPITEPAVTLGEKFSQPTAETTTPDVTQRKRRKALPKPKEVVKQQTGLMIGTVVVVMMVACVSIAIIWWVLDGGLLQLGPAAPAVVGINQLTPTVDVTATPAPSPTSPPTQVPRRAVDYVLQIDDLPSYFEIDTSGSGVERGDWQDGYANRFNNPSYLENSDPSIVVSMVYVFEGADEAKGQPSRMVGSLAANLVEAASQDGFSASTRQLSVTEFADEVSAYEVEAAGSSFYLYGFRRDNVVAIVEAVGFSFFIGDIQDECHFFASTILTRIDRDTR